MLSTSRLFLRPVTRIGVAHLRATTPTFVNSQRTYAIQARAFENNNNSNNNTNSWNWTSIGFITGAVLAAGYLTNSWFAKEVDYKKVRKAIEKILEDENYDDGSYGPVFIRLAWHASGTYSHFDKSGGSNGGNIRFAPEKDHGCNAGLDKAMSKLESIKEKFPDITYADLYVLASVVAIEAMGGPKIDFQPGRTDNSDGKLCTPDGRLPDASKGSDHIRAIFYRMGFNDKDIVALVGGGHALGRCHKDRSGYEGPWTRSPTTFTNDFFVQLKENKWTEKKWDGPKQYEDQTGELMMLPTDMEMLNDSEFRKYTDKYAEDEETFFKDFASAFGKLVNFSVEGAKKKDLQSALKAEKKDIRSERKQDKKDKKQEKKDEKQAKKQAKKDNKEAKQNEKQAKKDEKKENKENKENVRQENKQVKKEQKQEKKDTKQEHKQIKKDQQQGKDATSVHQDAITNAPQHKQ